MGWRRRVTYNRNYPNRTICSVLIEMRKCDETKNYSYLLSLIEEVQSMANRMEAALEDQHDVKYSRAVLKELNKEISKLEKKKEKLSE